MKNKSHSKPKEIMGKLDLQKPASFDVDKVNGYLQVAIAITTDIVAKRCCMYRHNLSLKKGQRIYHQINDALKTGNGYYLQNLSDDEFDWIANIITDTLHPEDVTPLPEPKS